jgi:hypothetical protein
MSGSNMRTLVVLICLQVTACLHAFGQYDPTQILNAWQERQEALTLVSSHRGDVNGSFANNMPEDSLGTFQNAVDAGTEIVEMGCPDDPGSCPVPAARQDAVPHDGDFAEKPLQSLYGFN